MAQQAEILESKAGETIKRGPDLLSQQIWCWGQDIVRPEGNWLIEIGFDRLAAPADRENCSSVYSLELPRGRRVVLRGFGVFFGADQLGGVFLQRYEFRPEYTTQSVLERPLWSTGDLPALSRPSGPQRERAVALTVELIDWISSYEAEVADRLGVDYRQATLDTWKNNKRPVVSAPQLTDAWRNLGAAVADNYRAFVA